jgi:hypothetical protein
MRKPIQLPPEVRRRPPDRIVSDAAWLVAPLRLIPRPAHGLKRDGGKRERSSNRTS